MQFHEAVERFLRSCRLRLSPATVKTYARDLALLDQFAPDDLATITIDDLEAVLEALTNRTERFTNHPRRPTQAGGLSPHTIRRICKSWRTMFNWCVDRDYIPRAPTRALKLPTPRASPEDKAITADDLLAMLAHCKNKKMNRVRDAAIILTLADTACRIGGLASMTFPHLNLAGGSARVVEKGGRPCTVYFCQYTATAISEWLRIRPAADHPYVWTSTRGHGPLASDHLGAVFRRVAIDATGKSLGPHSARHRSVQALLDAGINAELVSKKANHRNVTITLTQYGNQGGGRVKAITDRHPLIALGGPPPTDDNANIIRFPA